MQATVPNARSTVQFCSSSSMCTIQCQINGDNFVSQRNQPTGLARLAKRSGNDLRSN